MPISAETLFHFTGSIDNLVNILTHEFRPKYCFEDYAGLLPVMVSKETSQMGVPMNCFCDLPLSDVRKHLEYYGNYGIGLSKEWGIESGLNPVVYLSPESLLARYIQEMGVALVMDVARTGNLQQTGDERDGFNSFLDMMAFMKPYEGPMPSHTRHAGKMRRFYDEREWRHVHILPPEAIYRLGGAPSVEEVELANQAVVDKSTLPFEPKDIRYIIVAKEDEIGSMIDAVQHIKGRHPFEQVKVLASRIISAERIAEDF